MRADHPRLVLDANIMVSMVLGRSFPLLLSLYDAGVLLFAPVQQIAETRHVLVQRPVLTAEWVDAQMSRLLALIIPLHPAMLEKQERRARARLEARGQPDWPVVAGALATGGAAWSHDRDLFGTGVAVWTTRALGRQMEPIAG